MPVVPSHRFPDPPRFRFVMLVALFAGALSFSGCGLISTLALPGQPEGFNCDVNADCADGYICSSGECVLDESFVCNTDADCDAGYMCSEGACLVAADTVPEDADERNVYTCSCTCNGPGNGQDHSVVLDVCMPDNLNPNVDGPSAGPSDDALQVDCTGRVEDTVEVMSQTCVSSNIQCDCDAIVEDVPPERSFRDECNTPCAGVPLAPDCSNWDPKNGVKTASQTAATDPVCVVQSTDPPAPIPDPVSAFLYGRNSLCEVSGSATVSVGDEEGEPDAHGRLNVWGDPCPSTSCNVGVAYQLFVDPITFPGFLGFGERTVEELNFGGASLPVIVALDIDGAGSIGAVQSRSSGRGRSDDEVQALWAYNASPLDVIVDWNARTCDFAGGLAGSVSAPGADAPFSVDVYVGGTLSNQPPHAEAGSDQQVECTSTDGASVTLDAIGSTDPDANLALVQWRVGSRGGMEIGDAEASVTRTQPLGPTSYYLKVVDKGFQADEDTVNVTVVDTIPPSIQCPADLDVTTAVGQCSAARSFTVTASDACDSPTVSCVDQDDQAVDPAGHTFPVGTTTVTCTATTTTAGDPAKNTAECSFDVTVNDPPGLQVVGPASQAVQYSDRITPVTITATDCGTQSLTLESSASVPSNVTTSASECAPTAGGGTECTWTLEGQILVSAGTKTWQVWASDGTLSSTKGTVEVMVVAEDASVVFDDANPVALQVAMDGGASGPFGLTIFVTETLPDQPNDGNEAPGDIRNALASMRLTPVGPGTPVDGTCTPQNAAALAGDSYDDTLEVRCDFNEVPVNVYDVFVSVDGGYYVGSAADMIVVFDPSLGFTTGGGTFYWPGTTEKTNCGYTMKYNKKGTQVQGNLLCVRHRPDGNIYRLKSNAITGLAMSPLNSAFGWASFTGKGTFQDWDWLEPMGNYSFTAYVEDHGEPGTSDRFWLKVLDKSSGVVAALSMADPATANAATITRGNIFVPHTRGTR